MSFFDATISEGYDCCVMISSVETTLWLSACQPLKSTISLETKKLPMNSFDAFKFSYPTEKLTVDMLCFNW